MVKTEVVAHGFTLWRLQPPLQPLQPIAAKCSHIIRFLENSISSTRAALSLAALTTLNEGNLHIVRPLLRCSVVITPELQRKCQRGAAVLDLTGTGCQLRSVSIDSPLLPFVKLVGPSERIVMLPDFTLSHYNHAHGTVCPIPLIV